MVRDKSASERNWIKLKRLDITVDRIRSIFQFALAFGVEFYCEQNGSKRLVQRMEQRKSENADDMKQITDVTKQNKGGK
ncbi:hypothetical protein T10_7758 [Trichinella papuae]|uniref:Uncharacterized protein n=1 Tax=Trichinella papuae TaxID=268474 RepID=A0A0V1MXK5_9BILA|nr:hypothetical protein T10_7758 [Trichinella papuae]